MIKDTVKLLNINLHLNNIYYLPKAIATEPATTKTAPTIPLIDRLSGTIRLGAITDTTSTEIKVTIGAAAKTALTRDDSQCKT